MQISSGFGAPVFHFAVTGSTMDEARRLAAEGCPEGSLVIADWQSAGRGRTKGRRWQGEPGQSLLATLVAPRSWKDLPGLSLRVGLALALACDDCRGGPPREDDLEGGPDETIGGSGFPIELKWPNDLMANLCKLGGVLCESTPGAILAGFGINVAQREFGGELAATATSLAMLSGGKATTSREELADACLRRLADIEETRDWREKIEARLWMRGRRVRIATGLPDAGEWAEVRIVGIDADGALLAEDREARPLRFFSAELGPAGTR